MENSIRPYRGIAALVPAALAVILAGTLAGCGGGATPASSSTAASAAAASPAHTSNTPGMNMSGGSAMSSGPGAAQAGKTITIDANDSMRFVPSSLSVHVGETIAFKVVNQGATAHEFVLGNQQMQQEHEAEMSKGHMDMSHDSDAVDVAAGETGTLVYTFQKPGTLIYACHEAGHYAAGMKGTIMVTA